MLKNLRRLFVFTEKHFLAWYLFLTINDCLQSILGPLFCLQILCLYLQVCIGFFSSLYHSATSFLIILLENSDYHLLYSLLRQNLSSIVFRLLLWVTFYVALTTTFLLIQILFMPLVKAFMASIFFFLCILSGSFSIFLLHAIIWTHLTQQLSYYIVMLDD